mmetsp:Transcript_18215/g.54967  ORF Transcript_18215/g.54967 Transcript_18215/m.54967 type:complete len:200 (+) Transcript_18215:1478-2077(+)
MASSRWLPSTASQPIRMRRSSLSPSSLSMRAPSPLSQPLTLPTEEQVLSNSPKRSLLHATSPHRQGTSAMYTMPRRTVSRARSMPSSPRSTAETEPPTPTWPRKRSLGMSAILRSRSFLSVCLRRNTPFPTTQQSWVRRRASRSQSKTLLCLRAPGSSSSPLAPSPSFRGCPSAQRTIKSTWTWMGPRRKSLGFRSVSH